MIRRSGLWLENQTENYDGISQLDPVPFWEANREANLFSSTPGKIC